MGPAENRSFEVFTAYQASSRTFYVAGQPTTGQATIWSASVDVNVTSVTNLRIMNFIFPDEYGTPIRMHSLEGNIDGDLLMVFKDGTVFIINSITKSFVSNGNVLMSNQTVPAVTIMPASFVLSTNVANTFYQLIFAVDIMYINAWSVEKMAGTTTVINVARHGSLEKWYSETTFHAVWLSGMNQFCVFNMAVSPDIGFDQMILVSLDGSAEFLYYNLIDAGNIGFNVDPVLLEDDTYQTGCYDAVSNRLYFQGAVYAGMLTNTIL